MPSRHELANAARQTKPQLVVSQKTGTDNMPAYANPQAGVDYNQLDAPAVIRRNRASTVEALQQSGVVHDPDSNPAPGMFTQIEFVVGDFESGTMDCDIEEVIPAGYVPTYTAGATTGVADAVFSDGDGCHYELIEGGQFTCHIFNELQPVDVIVEKIWIDENPEFQQSTVVEVTLECDGPIVGGFQCLNGDGLGGSFCDEQFIDPNNPGVFEVLPDFEGTSCTATEELLVGVVTDESDCEEMIESPLCARFRMASASADCPLANATAERSARRTTVRARCR